MFDLVNKLSFTAPVLDRLLSSFNTGLVNSKLYDKKVLDVTIPLFHALSGLMPSPKNHDMKSIWVCVPRGTIDDFGDYEEMLEYGEVDSHEDFESLWQSEYPDKYVWYQLSLFEYHDKQGNLSYKGIIVNNYSVLSASFQEGIEKEYWLNDVIIDTCNKLLEAVSVSMKLLKEGIYNDFLNKELPYQYRKGVVQRHYVMEAEPEMKENLFKGLSEETYIKFCKLIDNGQNQVSAIKPLQSMTANDFFKACALGYKACRYKGTTFSPMEQYFMHADGRDEGLTGKGSGLHSEYGGVNPDSPSAWDTWFHDKDRFGGHPWEVCRGGNSTHVSLYVVDGRDVKFGIVTGKITEDEAKRIQNESGYYFCVAGKAWTRAAEAINFYVAIHEAGYPVILADADAILARLQGKDWIGIVPHSMIPAYCESMFPTSYGVILDFMHVYKEEDLWFDKIQWLPIEEAIFVKSEQSKVE